MKHLKAKLLTSVVMLLVAAVMMSTASYAWFTLSTNPEMKGIDTQIVVNENLEIALCTGTTVPGSAAGDSIDTNGKTWLTTAYTWGNLVDFTDDAITAYKDVNKNMRPATLNADGAFLFPKYGTDGRVTTVDGAITDPATYGIGTLVGADGLVYGYYIDFWMRSNVGGTVKLVEAAKRSSGTSAVTGAGSTFTAGGTTAADSILAQNIRVAFKVLYECKPGDKASTMGTYTAVTRTGDKAVASTTTLGAADGAAATITNNSIVTLTANQPVIVRAYFYLEGANVTNAAASTDTTTVKGTFNLQFGIDAVDHSMDKAETTTGGGSGT